MSIRVMTKVWDEAPYDGGTLLVLLALADFSNDDGVCWPSVESLGKKSRLSKSQTLRILGTLVEDGAIERRRRFQKSNVYTFRPPYVGAPDTPAPHRSQNDTYGENGDIGRTHDTPYVAPMTPDPSLEPSGSNKKEKEDQLEKLVAFFTGAAGIFPSSMNYDDDWAAPLSRILGLVDGDYGAAKGLVADALQASWKTKYTVASPKSIYKMAVNLHKQKTLAQEDGSYVPAGERRSESI